MYSARWINVSLDKGGAKFLFYDHLLEHFEHDIEEYVIHCREGAPSSELLRDLEDYERDWLADWEYNLNV